MGLKIDSSITGVIGKSGLNITKIIRKSDGALLWPIEYYAYQNGIVNPAMGIINPWINTNNVRNGRYATDPYLEIYDSAFCVRASVRADEQEDGPIVGITTPNLPTNGLTNVTIEARSGFISDVGGVGTAFMKLYGISADGIEISLYDNWMIDDTDYYEAYPRSITYNISAYPYIRVEVGFNTSGGSSGLNKNLFVGIKNVRFY